MEYKLKAMGEMYLIHVGEKTFMLPFMEGEWATDEMAVRALAKTKRYEKSGVVFKTQNEKWWAFLPEGEAPEGILFCSEPEALKKEATNSPAPVNYPAHPTYNGDNEIEFFTVLLGGLIITAPYVGECDTYMDADMEAEYLREIYPETGYVCHVTHNRPQDYILFLPKGMKWSAGGYKEDNSVYITTV